MDDDHELADLCGAYALDALDDLERRRFEAHLAGCPTCTAEVAAFQDVAAALGEGSGTVPPPALRDTVLAAASRASQDRGDGPAPTPSPSAGPAEGPAPAGRGRRLLPMVGMAAAAVLVVGVMANELRQTRDRLDHAESIQAVLAAPDALSFPLVGEGVSGRIVSSPSGPGSVLVAGGLPAVAEGRAYTLWLIRGEQPVAVHQFRVDDRDRAVELVPTGVEGFDAAGITEEAAATGLPPAPTGPILVQADLCTDCG